MDPGGDFPELKPPSITLAGSSQPNRLNSPDDNADALPAAHRYTFDDTLINGYQHANPVIDPYTLKNPDALLDADCLTFANPSR